MVDKTSFAPIKEYKQKSKHVRFKQLYFNQNVNKFLIHIFCLKFKTFVDRHFFLNQYVDERYIVDTQSPLSFSELLF